MPDYKETLNLPKTEFPMKANLPAREPEILRRWQAMGLERLVEEATAGRPTFVLHDGPPYANGDIHMGTALNKVLKDIVNKFRTSVGYRTPFVPGWDTHGLPIERRVIETYDLDRSRMDPLELRRLCRDFALSYIRTMTEQFRRLGVRADWEHPYVTLEPAYEAAEIRVFGEMFQKGLIYRGLRSVNWCPGCETALAEAEIEYREHVAASLYVAFPVVRVGEEAKGRLVSGDELWAWTTTAWTLPANEALAVHPELVYVLLTAPGGRRVVVAEAAIPRLAALGLELGPVSERFLGRQLAGTEVGHPIAERTVPVLVGRHVTAEEGTGIVHTAPGHGEEDFELGQQYGLPVSVVVDERGRFTDAAGPELAGLPTDEGYAVIVRRLASRDRLRKETPVTHQYPHCWRCHSPILFRATVQWFGSVAKIRQELLSAIGEVNWIPSWGQERMRRMTEEREDWCVSRQRVWGLPIPAFYCEDCQEVVVTAETIAHVASLVAQYGSDVWFERSAAELLPPGFTCPRCGHDRFRKETDTLDVWFDSGSSHRAVLEERGLGFPADLYLEGDDQFRGYFNSSLTTAVATRGRAPYRSVVCHGFVMDGEGRKMSKSLGNVIRPEDLLDRYGADILRLWAAATDYKADVRISEAIMAQVAEMYRKIRNTIRFLLGNLQDFRDDTDRLPVAQLPILERYILTRFADLSERTRRHYLAYDFHLVVVAVHQFTVLELSNFYLDVRKDILYTARADDPERRAAQTACSILLRGLLTLLQPILTFTAEEAYGYLPKRQDDPPTVQLLPWPTLQRSLSEAEEEDMAALLELRDQVLKALEGARAEKRIGTSLQAKVVLEATTEELPRLRRHAELLPTLFIVSQVEIVPAASSAVRIELAEGERCARCWRVLPEVGRLTEQPELCGRCAEVMTLQP